jgi:hypothetical protein
MSERYPGYDVMAKRHTPSWDRVTRAVIDRRLAVHRGPRFFDAAEWETLGAVCARIMPQPADRPAVPLPAYVDQKLYEGRLDGYRIAPLPPQDQAWRRGLAALDAEARAAHGGRFHELGAAEQDALLRAMQDGRLTGEAWAGMPCRLFFNERVLNDIVRAYYAHPVSWSEIGFGGPASPRGYVRMDFDRRDPWEAAESQPGQEARAERENKRVGAR